MITPMDIQNKEFKKNLIGYNTKDVNEYLEYINKDYEDLYRENIELKDKVGILTDQIRQYNNLEETLKETLVLAQATADEVTKSSRKKADLIVEEAELDAYDLINDANERVSSIKKEYANLKKEMLIFKARYEAFIEGQLATVKDFYNNFDEIDESKKITENDSDELQTDVMEAY